MEMGQVRRVKAQVPAEEWAHAARVEGKGRGKEEAVAKPAARDRAAVRVREKVAAKAKVKVANRTK